MRVMRNLRVLTFVVGAIFLAMGGFMASTASPARAISAIANTIADNPPAPSCADPFVFSGKQSKCVPCPPGTVKDGKTQTCKVPATTGVTATFIGVKASASDVDTGKVTILADMNLRAGVKVNPQNCVTTRRGQVWYSGGWGVNGKAFEKETVPGTLCRSSKSNTGWVKVSGGKTGRRCFNEAKIGKAPGPVVKGRVIWVSSLAQVRIRLHAQARAYAVNPNCPGSFAEGKGTADVTITLRQYVRSRGSIISRLSADAYGKATASATAQVVCPITTTVVTTTTPTPTTTTTTVTTTPPTPVQPPSVSNVTSPEEIYANGETYPNICATAYGRNGNSLTMVFSANYGSFPSSTFTFTSSGTNRICTTYKAPNDATAVGHNDQITVNIHDNSTGLNGSAAQSMTFPIKSPPSRP